MNSPDHYRRRRDNKRIFFTLLLLWFLVNIVQSVLTEIISDEAYYYLYGKYLAWGYFDHPPMVALMVKLSSLLFKGNLGIRFMTVALQLATLTLIWKSADIEKPSVQDILCFFAIAASISIFAAYGFITTPDSGLLFFAALFLFAYKRFLAEDKWSNVLLLSVSMAGLVYSKYQAILVIGFVILSNPSLMRSLRFWIAGISSLILLSPHIHWQITNGFPSLSYQLVDRSEHFRWVYILEYLPYQIATFNPFVLGAVAYVLIRYRPVNLFDRSLWFQVSGFFLFFWIATLRGHVEPHWTAACSGPVIILLLNRMGSDPALRRFISRFIAPSLIIILFARISLLTDIPFIYKAGLNGKQEKIDFIESVSEDLPVAFISSFQLPSMYTFFTGKEAFTVSTLNTRQTQFDIWQLENKYVNKPVFIACSEGPRSKYYENEGFAFYGYRADSLQITNRLKIIFEMPAGQVRPGETLKIGITIINPCSYDISFTHPEFPVEVCAAYIRDKDIHIITCTLSSAVAMIRKDEKVERLLETKVPEVPAGVYHFGIALNSALGPTPNSSFYKIKIGNHD